MKKLVEQTFRDARGYEQPGYWVMFLGEQGARLFDQLLRPDYSKRDNSSHVAIKMSGMDVYLAEASIVAAEHALDGMGRPMFDADQIAVARGRYGLGQPRFRTLYVLHQSLLRFLSTAPDVGAWPDLPFWLWGPPARTGPRLKAAVSTMGRGKVLSNLRMAGWTEDAIAVLVDQWLHASRVHGSAVERCRDLFAKAHAPVITNGTTKPAAPTAAMIELADKFLPDDRHASVDLATVFAWIKARARGGVRVSVPTSALLNGRKAHADAAGITAQRGQQLWPVLRDKILSKTRNHRAGHHAAEYEIRPEYRAALLGD